jgi:hypothetical protein
LDLKKQFYWQKPAMSSKIQLTVDELNVLVTISIMRAQSLDGLNNQLTVKSAWHEVLKYETCLSSSLAANTIPGGVARVGAVTAALAAGRIAEAYDLKERFSKDLLLSLERRTALTRVLNEFEFNQQSRFPALALLGRSGVLTEVSQRRPHSRGFNFFTLSGLAA